MKLLCKGTYALVAHPFKGQEGQCSHNVPPFWCPCMRNCGVTKTLCAGVVAGTRIITLKKTTTLTKPLA